MITQETNFIVNHLVDYSTEYPDLTIEYISFDERGESEEQDFTYHSVEIRPPSAEAQDVRNRLQEALSRTFYRAPKVYDWHVLRAPDFGDKVKATIKAGTVINE